MVRAYARTGVVGRLSPASNRHVNTVFFFFFVVADIGWGGGVGGDGVWGEETV